MGEYKNSLIEKEVTDSSKNHAFHDDPEANCSLCTPDEIKTPEEAVLPRLEASENQNIIEDLYNNHDCHLGPEDSCSACEDYYMFKYAKNNEDFKGLDSFLQGRYEQLLKSREATKENSDYDNYHDNQLTE